MYSVNFIYGALTSKKKERFAIILEPLQAILQLALLSFAPVDSKLTICNNILYIQIPNWNQSVMRTYNNDSKNDLFYLFNVFIRFNKFYQHLKSINNKKNHDTDNNNDDNNNDNNNNNNNNNDNDNDNDGSNMSFFTLLKDLATKGIDKLLQTYKQTDNPALLHTLNIYKNLLNNPEQQELANQYASMDMFTDNSTMIANNKNLRSSSRQRTGSGSNHNQIIPQQSVEIDNVFVNITKLYTDFDLIIMFNTLQLLIQNPQNYIEYTEGLNKLMEPINKQIQKWIVDNIVY
jgi:hypothetical protein